MYEIRVHTWLKQTFYFSAASDKQLNSIVKREKSKKDTAAVFANKVGKKEKKLYQAKKNPYGKNK